MAQRARDRLAYAPGPALRVHARWVARRLFARWRQTLFGRRFRVADLLACLLVGLGLFLPSLHSAFAFFSAATGNPNDSLGTASAFAPTNLALTAACPDIRVTWTAPAGGWAASYRLFRSASSGGENLASPLATGLTATSYTDTSAGLVSGTPYYYEVQAISAGGGGGPATVSTEMSILYDCTLTVASVAPSNGQTNVSKTSKVAVTFNDTMAVSQPAGSLTLQQCSDSTCASLGAALTVTLAVSGNTVTLTPTSALTASTWYLVTATTALVGAGGQTLASDFTSAFETGTGSSNTPPVVVPPTSPSDGAANVPANTAVTLTFSNTMDQASTQGAFSLEQTSGSACYVDGGTPLCSSNGGSFAWSGASQNILTFTPTANLLTGATYKVNVTTAATDIFGNAMTSAYSFTFTTVAPDTTAPNAPSVTSPTSVLWSSASSYTIQGTVSSGATETSYDVRVYNDNINCATYHSGDSVSGLTVAASETLTGSLTTFSIATPLATGTSNCFLVTATDEANNVSASTAVVLIHQGNTETTMGTLTLAPSFNSIAVTLTYTDDANKNNSATVAYCAGASCTNFGAATAMTGGGASGSPFTATISGLSSFATYTVEVSVSDSDGVSGTNPVTGSAATLGFLSESSSASTAFASRSGASGTIKITGPGYESADVKVNTTSVRDLGCQTLSTSGVNYTWDGKDGGGAYVADGTYTFTATDYFGGGCGFALGSVTGSIQVSNAASISMQPAPASVTLFPGQSVTVTATVANSLNALVPDGTPLTWSAVGSVTGNMNADLGGVGGTVGSGAGCSVSASTGQACVVLTLPTGSRTIQTITVTASVTSQVYDTTTATTVTGQTTIIDPPAAPSDLAPSPDGRAAGYKIYIGTRSHSYPVVIDAGNVLSYEYKEVTPGTTYYVTVRAYNAVGVLSRAAGEGVLTIPLPTPTPTATATATSTPTPTATASATATVTPTTTPSPTASPSPTSSPTATPTLTPSPTPKSAALVPAVAPASPSPFPSPPTRTPSPSATPLVPSPTACPAATAITATPVAAAGTATATPTPTPVSACPPTATATETATATPSASATVSSTATATPTATPPSSPIATSIPATSPTAVGSPTPRPIATANPTAGATPTGQPPLAPSPSPTVASVMPAATAGAVPTATASLLSTRPPLFPTTTPQPTPAPTPTPAAVTRR